MITLQRRGIVDEYRGYSFARPSVAFDSRGRMALPGNARFESIAGRRGVWVEEGTTNLFDPTKNNPDVEVITENVDGVQTTVYKLDATTNADFEDFQSNSRYPADPTKTYTITWKAKWNNRPSFDLRCYNSSGTRIANATVTLVVNPNPDPTKYQYYEMRVTLPANTTQCEFFRWWYSDGDNTSIGYIARPQLEARPYSTSWTPGGTTRAAETLTVPTAGVLDPQEGTVEFFVTPLLPSSVMAMRLGFHDFAWNNADTNGFIVQRGNAADRIQFISLRSGGPQYLNHSRSWNAGDRLGIAVRWSAAGMECFVNGVKVGTLPLFDPPSASTAGLGCRLDTGTQGNAIYGPFRISRRARTDQEIAAAYAAGYMEADADTTLLLPFDGPDAQRAAKAVVI